MFGDRLSRDRQRPPAAKGPRPAIRPVGVMLVVQLPRGHGPQEVAGEPPVGHAEAAPARGLRLGWVLPAGQPGSAQPGHRGGGFGVGLSLIFHRDVDRKVKRRVCCLARRIRKRVDVPHDVLALFFPTPVVQFPGDRPVFGCFAYNATKARIYVAADPEADGQLDKELFVCETLCHELAHYEQWRDGRKVQNRGAEIRGQWILRKALGL